jgi:hypothetical protein
MQPEIKAELDRIRQSGLALPTHPYRAAQSVGQMYKMATSSSMKEDVLSLPWSRTTDPIQRSNSQQIRSFKGRRGMTKSSMVSPAGGGADLQLAMPRWYDPMEYWELTGLPWNMADEGHRHKLHKWLRLYALTHDLVGLLIDIYTRFPLSGMRLTSPDNKLTTVYEDIFLDDYALDYSEFLVQLGREYWLVGEAFPQGSFNENLGTWEYEDFINPEDIVIENFPLLDERQLKIMPPDYLKRLVSTRSPSDAYKILETRYPEWLDPIRRGEAVPISKVLLKQVANYADPWSDHGTPILLRGLRTLIHEEKLLASQDAVAERLYSPLLLAKLGVMDMGPGNAPLLPTPEDLDMLRDQFDVAMASDFRLIVSHFGIDLTAPIGRESVPDLSADFDRVDRKLMQVFGINPSLLSAGSNSQPYASSALQAEFMNQVLRTYQKYLKKHFRERALVVAEAQGHYASEKKGQTLVPIMERVQLTEDEYEEMAMGNRPMRVVQDLGDTKIVELNKLMVPELEMAVLDMRDEATQRNFMLQLRSMGVPIPDEELMVGLPFTWTEGKDKFFDEMKKKTVTQQQEKLETYEVLEAQGVPIPQDIVAEMAAQAPSGGGGGSDPGPHAESPGGGMVLPDAPPEVKGLGAGGAAGLTPAARPEDHMGPVPEVSNERRQNLNYGQGGRPLGRVEASLDHKLPPPVPRPRT